MGEGRATYHSPTNQKNLTTFTVWDERARGGWGDLTALYLPVRSVVLPTTPHCGHDIGLLLFSKCLYSFIFLCSVFFLVRYYGPRRHSTHLYLPYSPIAYLTLSHARSLIPLCFLQRRSSRSNRVRGFVSACAAARSARSLFFLCDRRIALSCSGYSPTAFLDELCENKISIT